MTTIRNGECLQEIRTLEESPRRLESHSLKRGRADRTVTKVQLEEEERGGRMFLYTSLVKAGKSPLKELQQALVTKQPRKLLH